MNEGRVAEARLRFEQAIQLRPDLVDAQNNLGLACNAQGEPDQALASFEHAVRTDPNHFGALTNLANACKTRGERPKPSPATVRPWPRGRMTRPSTAT